MSPSQFVLKSNRTHFGQLVLKMLVSLYSFGQFVLMQWSIRTHFDRFVLILVNLYSCCNGNESTKNEYKLTKRPLGRIYFSYPYSSK